MSSDIHNEHGDSEAQRFWEGHYQAHERIWSGHANAVLVDVVGSLPIGTALDLGCGEGGDAIWLAGLGWRVTAVDVSATAIERAAAHATAAGVRDCITFQRHDLAHTFPAGAFDLVSAQYLHSPVELPRERILQTAAHAVAPGGLLLIVDHASVSPWSWADPDTRFPSPEEIMAPLALADEEWRAERVGAAERQATGPNGQVATVTDNVIALRRATP